MMDLLQIYSLTWRSIEEDVTRIGPNASEEGEFQGVWEVHWEDHILKQSLLRLIIPYDHIQPLLPIINAILNRNYG